MCDRSARELGPHLTLALRVFPHHLRVRFKDRADDVHRRDFNIY